MRSKVLLIGFLVALVFAGCGTSQEDEQGLVVQCDDPSKISVKLLSDSPSGEALAGYHRLLAKFSISTDGCQLPISTFTINTISQGVYASNMQIYPEEFDEDTLYDVNDTSYTYNFISLSNGCFEKESVDLQNGWQNRLVIIEPDSTKNIVVRGDISSVMVKNPDRLATQKIQLTSINAMELLEPVMSEALVYKTNVGTIPPNCPATDSYQTDPTLFGINPNF